MDSLSALQAFVRAAEFRSFTDAGRELRLSSSAIGKAISRLEERHGVQLLNRSTRSITLTHEGQMLLESCRRIFSEIENVEKEFAETKGAPKGKLRVSMPLLGGVAASLLARFLKEYPDIELDADFAERPAEVIDGGYDVVVRAGDVDDSRLMSRRVGSYRPALVCSPGYLAQRAGEPDRAEDLINHACLHLKDAATGKLHPWPFASSEMSDVCLQVTAVANATEALIGCGHCVRPRLHRASSAGRRIAEAHSLRVSGIPGQPEGNLALKPIPLPQAARIHRFPGQARLRILGLCDD
jgi:DNA-binding transcriptional LysR family regulator